MKILITGATGLVGKSLGIELARRGHELFTVSRNAKKVKSICPFPTHVVEHDLNTGPISSEVLPKIDAVINLMGEPIAEGRWTELKKKKLIESRVKATKNLVSSFGSEKVKSFISSSAIGYYGDQAERELTEMSPPGQGFLPQLCQDWEAAALSAMPSRVVLVRTGIVLSRNGGALKEMLPPLMQGLGGKLGNGQQFMSWIHIDDLVNIYINAVEDDTIIGPINATAPQPVSNEEFTQTLAKVIDKPAIMPVPQAALQLMFGEKASILLESQKVIPSVLLNRGFDFKHITLEGALQEEVGILKSTQIFENQQFINLPIEKVFDFFSNPKNLESITPDTLNFQIVDMNTPNIEKGTLINYRLKIHGMPAKWTTLIEEWKPPFRFVDTQLHGPYYLWHHTHTFEKLANGTLMKDRVLYKLPLGGLGQLAAGWLVKKDVENIFQFRTRKIDQLIGQGH